jgi:hypothetical protein
MPVTPANPGKNLDFRRMPADAAAAYLQQKGFHLGFDWRDTPPALHQVSFTAAKMMQMEVLQDLHAALRQAQGEGLPFREFLNKLKPELEKKGWWGLREVTDPVTGESKLVDVGSSRLKRIYNTNLRRAHGEGQWQRAQASKKAFPYIRYDGCNSASNRADHCAWDGLVFPIDSDWAQRHIPTPKEWGCKCRWNLLTAGQVERQGLVVRPGQDETYIRVNGEIRAVPEKYIEWKLDRPGLPPKTVKAPLGVHPAFHYPPGGWAESLAQVAMDKLAELPAGLAAAVGSVAVGTTQAALAGIYGERWIDTTLQAAKRALQERAGGETYGLSDTEMVALRGWTADGDDINKALLQGNPAYAPYIAEIQAALDKLPAYRGQALSGQSKVDMQDLRGFLANGEVVSFAGFLASSYRSPFDEYYMLTIRSISGKKIDMISGKPDEYEVLFKPGAKFRVVSVFPGKSKDGADRILVVLEELNVF